MASTGTRWRSPRRAAGSRPASSPIWCATRPARSPPSKSRPAASRRCGSSGRLDAWAAAPSVSTERYRVHQAAVGPQRVLAALELEGRVLADIALEAVAVVPDLLDDVVHPLLVDADRLAVARCDAEEALDGGIV